MTFSPAPAAAPPAAFPRSAAAAHQGRRVGLVFTNGARLVGVLNGWGTCEISITRDRKARRFPVGQVAYVVNLHTFPR